ncbi:MAG: glutamine-hydrolyzing GMP synthase [Myxococcales bacterium]|nr:glutamine-hydrolyzing GMP synthase [Myxococcales bacterium]
MSNRLLILDFGSQYTMLIARRVRELQVYCEIWPCTRSFAEISAWKPAGIILSGGPMSVTEEGAPHPPAEIFDMGVPILGICYGLQVMTQMLGGEVVPGDTREYGKAHVRIDHNDGVLSHWATGSEELVWMSHGDRIAAPAPGFVSQAETRDGVPAAVANLERRFYGLQFHPEVAHTPRGADVLAAFAHDLCGCTPSWTMAAFVDEAVATIQQQVGPEGRVLCGLSGGVDSSVAAALIYRAIGDRLTCVFVDNGLLRKDEAADVQSIFGDGMGLPLITVDAADRFLNGLAGVTDPERKRKVIGHAFIEVFDEAAHALPDEYDFLAQGTLYPDVIESVSFKGPSATIKSHHNVGGLPEHMKMALVEPLRELFKDEVRKLGLELGLPERMVHRQPFPGPGLAVRIIGEVNEASCALVRAADAIVREEIDAWPRHRELWQYFAVLLPVRSVGVMGDQRTYEATCAVRVVTSVDGMTADWVDLPHDLLGRISTRIINEVRGFNRVVYDITSKPPGTIEWE